MWPCLSSSLVASRTSCTATSKVSVLPASSWLKSSVMVLVSAAGVRARAPGAGGGGWGRGRRGPVGRGGDARLADREAAVRELAARDGVDLALVVAAVAVLGRHH